MNAFFASCSRFAFSTVKFACLHNNSMSQKYVLVEHSKRMQIQERLTKNIADDLYSQEVKGVAIVAQAEHLCMKMRGVRSSAEMTSSAFRGIFAKQTEKDNVISMIHNTIKGSHL